jgi:hypothetical protein
MNVTKQQALSLKELGFDETCSGIYPMDSDELIFKPTRKWNSCTNIHVSAPTVDDAIRWLREVKGVHVAILYNRISNVWDYIVYYLDNTLSATGYPSHDHAQFAGLDTAIDYVKNNRYDTIP